MADLLISAHIPRVGAVGTDEVVNTFAFHKEGDYVLGDATSIFSELQEFYSIAADGTTRSIGWHMSAELDRTVDICQFKAYDITGKLGNRSETQGPEPHGSPIAEGTWELDPAGAGGMGVSQVAGALTLRARDAWNYPVEAADGSDPGSAIDRPRARRTGRLYLGPLADDYALNLTGGTLRLSTSFMDTVLEKAEDLQDGVNALGWAWCVWSRSNAALSVIERVEIDDSVDIQRRRKAPPTQRLVRTFSPQPALALGA